MTNKKKPKDFESALERLEAITEQLEAGESSLEESIRLYTEGLEIARLCDRKLGEAEKRIKMIQESDGAAVEVETEADAADDDGEEDDEDEEGGDGTGWPSGR